jgi:hypothetical protein
MMLDEGVVMLIPVTENIQIFLVNENSKGAAL